MSSKIACRLIFFFFVQAILQARGHVVNDDLNVEYTINADDDSISQIPTAPKVLRQMEPGELRQTLSIVRELLSAKHYNDQIRMLRMGKRVPRQQGGGQVWYSHPIWPGYYLYQDRALTKL